MKKFTVRSGTLEYVSMSDTAKHAAIEALHVETALEEARAYFGEEKHMALGLVIEVETEDGEKQYFATGTILEKCRLARDFDLVENDSVPDALQ